MKRILVVDDSVLMRNMVKLSLKEIGTFDITEASDGAQALSLIEATYDSLEPQFDLVLLDWNMPNLTGIEVLQKCMAKKHPKCPDFIMVTAEQEQKSAITAVKAGAKDYINKPFSIPTLKKKLERFFNSRRAAA